MNVMDNSGKSTNNENDYTIQSNKNLFCVVLVLLPDSRFPITSEQHKTILEKEGLCVHIHLVLIVVEGATIDLLSERRSLLYLCVA